MSSVFDALQAVNVNGHTEKKKTGNVELTYLSWPFAWAEVKKRFPDAHYEVIKFNGLPYVFDERTGYMVYTTVTIDGITHEMWLPVMDGANKAMKAEPYSYETGFGQYKKTKVCEAATMFDINKTIMRCLVKNLAMFGLGLYIFAGEDLPIDSRSEEEKADDAKTQKVASQRIDTVKMSAITTAAESAGIPLEKILEKFQLKSIGDMTEEQFREASALIQKQKAIVEKKRANTGKH